MYEEAMTLISADEGAGEGRLVCAPDRTDQL
jgi:hypothetical protein